MHIQYTHIHQGGELFRYSVLLMFYLPNLSEIIRSILGTARIIIVILCLCFSFCFLLYMLVVFDVTVFVTFKFHYRFCLLSTTK